MGAAREVVQDLVKAERLGPRMLAPSEVAIEERATLERYGPVIALLVEGVSFEEAARQCGVGKQAVWKALTSHPSLYADLKRRRDILRELVHLRALGKAAVLLEGDAKISPRDLTDIIRATKGPGEDPAAQVNILIDV